MVSTRGFRYKFSEGERVLCYEPDPTKAKVLYDSKVLEVIESKDKRGRRTVEYLIHFQGWNSSWDRCVSEDFVLKDTEENRQLQRDLAEKSQLQLGAYLYRRERKKGSSGSASGGPTKRGRPGFSDDGSSSSTQPEDGDTGEAIEGGEAGPGPAAEGEAGDTDSSSASGAGSAPRSPPPAHCGRAHVALPSALRDRLTFDYHLVVKRGRLSRLPASPNAAQILESFVKWFARAGAWNPARPKHEPPHTQHKPDMLDVSRRLNLVREIADGLRVYFDFSLRSHLLYKQEHAQYQEMCGVYVNESEDIKSEPEDEECQSQEEALEGSEVLEELKSPRIPEYAHLPPDPVPPDSERDTGETDQEMTREKSSSRDGLEKNGSDHRNVNLEEKMEIEREIKREINCEESDSQNEWSTHMEVKLEDIKVEKNDSPEECSHQDMEVDKAKEVRPVTRSGNVARRLRSHKSAVSQSEGEEAPGPSVERLMPEPHSSSAGSSGGSSLSESWRAPPPPARAPPPPGRTPLSLLLDKVSRWQIIPRDESTEQLPCRVYGAIHLARLFVKLPDFLNAAHMPDFKLKLILKHIDMFVQYLEDHSEWFGEMYYIADNVSRSH